MLGPYKVEMPCQNKHNNNIVDDFTNPRAAEIHSLSVRAFNMVSAVVNVFETTTTANIFIK